MRLISRHACVAAAAVLAVLAAPAQAKKHYDARTVIVEYADGVSAQQKQELHGRAGVERDEDQIYGDQAWVAEVKRNNDPADVAERLNRSRLVRYAEVNEILTATAVPNDPRFPEMYGLAKIQAPSGWDLAGLGAFPSSGGPTVGIVDTGIDRSHADLAGKLVGCAQSRGVLIFTGTIKAGCDDDNGHGTHVSGTVTADTNNGIGVAGVAFNSPLVMCRALGGSLGTGNTGDVANCINWVTDQGVRVISMSLGGGDSTTLHNAVARAWSNGNGRVVVAAAGNDGNTNVNYPAGYPEVVSVAATDANDAHASFSNSNADVEVAAPGVNILSTYLGGGYTTLSGTSMATPHVAGAAALIAGKFGGTAASIRSRLDAGVDDLGAAGRDPQFGYGRINLVKALG